MSDDVEKKGIAPQRCPRCGGVAGDCIRLGEENSPVFYHDGVPLPDDIPMPKVKEPAEYSDTELLDWLQSKLGTYSDKVVCRWSTLGRGWRLHETRHSHGAVTDVRQAIINMIKAEKEYEEEVEDDGPCLEDEKLPPGGPA